MKLISVFSVYGAVKCTSVWDDLKIDFIDTLIFISLIHFPADLLKSLLTGRLNEERKKKEYDKEKENNFNVKEHVPKV